MKDNIKVSVIIPVYNGEKYIEELIESLRKQTLSSMEFIFVNDGSVDQSEKIILKHAKTDSRIRLFNKKNQGVSAARNDGIRLSIGEYIGFVDSDDYISANMYEILYNKAIESNADIVSCGRTSSETEFGSLSFNDEKIQLNRIASVKDVIENKYLGMAVTSKLFKRECIRDIWFSEKYKINEDRLFLFMAASKAENVLIIKRPLYFYRINEDSVTHEEFGIKRMDALYVADEMHRFVRMYYPELTQASEANIIRSAYSILLLMYKEKVVGKFEEQHNILINRIKSTHLIKLRKYLGLKRFVQLMMIKYCERAFYVIKKHNIK